MLTTWPNPHCPVCCFAWSPDGQRLVSGDHDGAVRVWDTNTGHLLASWDGHATSVTHVAWSRDGRRLASSGGLHEAIKIWDTSTGQMLVDCKGHTAAVTSVAWSPDDRHVASGSCDGTVKIWDTGTGDCVAALFFHSIPLHVVYLLGIASRVIVATADGRAFGYDVLHEQDALAGAPQPGAGPPIRKQRSSVDRPHSRLWRRPA